MLDVKLTVYYIAGLEKLTNANRSVSTVYYHRLFPVELTEIADWTSMSKCMLHSNFGQTSKRVIGGNLGACTFFILPLPYFLNICSPFWTVNQWKEKYFGISVNKLGSISTSPLEWFSQRSSAKCPGLICKLSKTKKNNEKLINK